MPNKFKFIGSPKSLEQLKQHFEDPDSFALDEHTKDYLDKLIVIDDLIKSGKYRQATIANMVTQRFSVTNTTAYRLIYEAKDLFGGNTKRHKDYYRQLYAEALEGFAQLAKTKNDYKTAAICIKYASEVRGLDKEDADLPDFTKLQQNTIELKLNAEVIKTLELLLQRGAIDLNQIRAEYDVVDVKHTEIKNDTDQDSSL